MLSKDALKEWATKWQTSVPNVAREYVQHLYLSHLFQIGGSDKLFFKGGTALRLLFKSPRFSEDLDFSGTQKPFHLEQLLSRNVSKIAKELSDFVVKESKPTSGGFFALYSCKFYEETISLEINISLRGRPRGEPILVTSPLIPSYQCLSLSASELVSEKAQALLTRRKPRDFFDIYFILRERLEIASLIPLKEKLTSVVREIDGRTIQKELKQFLPVGYHRIVATLQYSLLKELSRL